MVLIFYNSRLRVWGYPYGEAVNRGVFRLMVDGTALGDASWTVGGGADLAANADTVDYTASTMWVYTFASTGSHTVKARWKVTTSLEQVDVTARRLMAVILR